jgi:hypothetical protein
MTGLILWSFLQRQAQFSQFMSSNSSLTMSRYFRLMALAGVELLCTTPLSVFMTILNLTAQPLDPWVSWYDTHYNFSRVRLVPAVLWTMNRWLVVGIQFNRWSGPFCAFAFFAFFGFAAEARKNYCNAVSKVLIACRLKRDPSSPQKISPRSATPSHPYSYPLTCYLVSASLPFLLPQRCLLDSLYTHLLRHATTVLVFRQPPPLPTIRALRLSRLREPFPNSQYPLTKRFSNRNLHHGYSPSHYHHEHRRRRSLTTWYNFLPPLTRDVSLYHYFFPPLSHSRLLPNPSQDTPGV